MSQAEAASYVLPSALITRADLARLLREIESLDNELEAQKARAQATGKKAHQMPGVSKTLIEFVELNKIDMGNDHARIHFKEQMKVLKDKAPIIHMTFAVEADPESLRQLADYIRKTFHPQALLHVGLQPSLVGGVYMRTPNHVLDMSMRARLAQSRVVIRQDIDQMANAVPVVEAPPLENVPVAAAPAQTAVPALAPALAPAEPIPTQGAAA